MSKNYIEVFQDFHEEQSGPVDKSTVWVDEGFDVYYAVRPTAGGWRYYSKTDPTANAETERPFGGGAWELMGGKPVYVGSQTDVDGLRKLLDAVEAELQADESR